MDILRKLRGSSDEGARVNELISKLSEDKTVLRVELENTPVRFRSRLQLRSGAAVLRYPQELQSHIPKEARVRIQVPGETQEHLCMKISSSRYGGSGSMATELGQMKLLCQIPGATVEKPKRAAERFSTSRFTDVVFRLSSGVAEYSVVDMSKSGAKVLTASEEDFKHFPIGENLRKAVIRLGKKASVSVLDTIPRVHYPEAVGIEIVIDPNGLSRKTLDYFLDRLDQEETKPKQKAKPKTEASP